MRDGIKGMVAGGAILIGLWVSHGLPSEFRTGGDRGLATGCPHRPGRGYLDRYLEPDRRDSPPL
jgi:hypothetical protein